VARYLTERTSPAESFLIVGSEPEIYYYAERKASTRLYSPIHSRAPITTPPGCARNSRRDLEEGFAALRRPGSGSRVAHGMVGQFTPSARAGHSAFWKETMRWKPPFRNQPMESHCFSRLRRSHVQDLCRGNISHPQFLPDNLQGPPVPCRLGTPSRDQQVLSVWRPDVTTDAVEVEMCRLALDVPLLSILA